MLAPFLAACAAAQAFHVAPIQVDGPYFADELAAIRAAVAARVARLPEHCAAPEAEQWVTLAAEGRTRPDGPRCAAPPRATELLRARGTTRVIQPVLDGHQLAFEAGGHQFTIALAATAPRRWPSQIARARGRAGGRGGGGRLRGLTGTPLGVAVDLFQGVKPAGGAVDEAPISAALAPCREAGPRDPHLDLEYSVVVALDRQGQVTRSEHQEAAGSEGARACILEKIQGLRFPKGATRAVVAVHDLAPEPIPFARRLLNFRLEAEPGLITTSPLYREPRFRRCTLPAGETAFTLQLDATGRVVEARVPGLEPALAACAEEALRHVAFACPEGGPATVPGRMVVQ